MFFRDLCYRANPDTPTLGVVYRDPKPYPNYDELHQLCTGHLYELVTSDTPNVDLFQWVIWIPDGNDGCEVVSEVRVRRVATNN
jgi:hypothetical protein